MLTVTSTTLSPLISAALGALIASGMVGTLAAFIFKSWLASHQAYKPVAQNFADYLAFTELAAVHMAEAAGLNMGLGSQAKLKLAVDDVLSTLAASGVTANPSAVNPDKVRADINALVAKVYPAKK